jgi:lipoprotein
MKKKNITRSVLSLLLVALLGLSVTGCGKAQAPTLTDENTNGAVK